MGYLIAFAVASLISAPVTRSLPSYSNTSTTLPASPTARATCPSISADGTRIAFYAHDRNDYGGSGHTPGIILYDGSFTVCNGSWTSVSRPRISRDGKYVVFYGANSGNNVRPCLYRISDGAQYALSITASVSSTSDAQFPPGVSDDLGSDLPAVSCQEMNGGAFPPTSQQIRVWYPATSSTSVVSINGSSVPANAHCTDPVINDDGTVVAFLSTATNLASNSGGVQQVFIAANGWSTTEAASITSGGTLFNTASSFPTMDASGNVVAFENGSTTKNIYVRNRSGNSTNLAHSLSNNVLNFTFPVTSIQPCLSPDGGYITFNSFRALGGEFDPDNTEDTYPSGPSPRYNNGSMIFLVELSSGAVSMESFHWTGGLKKIRNGDFPVLSDSAGKLVFDSLQDRLDGSSFPSVRWIWIRQ